MDGPTSPDIFLFNGYRLDQRGGGLFRDSEADRPVLVNLGSRALDVLGVLVERHGQLVSKDEIMRAVWPNTVVEESNLTVHISALRRELDADRQGPSCIQTVPGRGYRFIATVTRPATSASDTGTSSKDDASPAPQSAVLGREQDSLSDHSDSFCTIADFSEASRRNSTPQRPQHGYLPYLSWMALVASVAMLAVPATGVWRVGTGSAFSLLFHDSPQVSRAPPASPPYVPANIAAFCGRWVGIWNHDPRASTSLTVVAVSQAGDVSGSYVFASGNPVRFAVKITDNAIKFGRPPVKFTFKLRPDGKMDGIRIYSGVLDTTILTRESFGGLPAR